MSLEILTKGGFLMVPIIIASFVAVYVFVARLLSLRKLQVDTRAFVLQTRGLLMRGHKEDALMLCANTTGPIAKMTRVGIENSHRDRLELKDAIESAGKAEIYTLEKHLTTLATVAGVAPMLGFLGTVTGMIQAFMEIQSRAGNVDATVLAGGIWEALITTAAGLAVGIVALILYNWLQNKVEHIVFQMEESTAELMDSLQQDAATTAPTGQIA